MQKFLPLIILIMLFSCNRATEKEVQLRLDKAKIFYENAEYGSAKRILDELKVQYPKQLDLQQTCLHFMRQIELKEQERNLTYCDSMLIVRLAEADSLKTYFVYEKDTVYDETGRYVEKHLASTLSSQKLRTGVEETGDIYLISVYSGVSPIRHNGLKVFTVSGEYVETENIPFDGGANYSYKDDNTGIVYELVTYRKGKDNGVIRFICNHSEGKLTAQYLGGKNYTYIIPQSFIESLSKTADLAAIFLDIQQLQKEKTKAEKRIRYLESKVLKINVDNVENP